MQDRQGGENKLSPPAISPQLQDEKLLLVEVNFWGEAWLEGDKQREFPFAILLFKSAILNWR